MAHPSWGDGLPRFRVVPRVGVMYSRVLLWLLDLGDGLLCFGMAPSVAAHVAHVHRIEHTKREQYPLLTGGNFWIHLVMGVQYGLGGLVPGL